LADIGAEIGRAFDHRWCCSWGLILVFAGQNRSEGEKKSKRESHSPGKRQIKKPVARTLGHLSREGNGERVRDRELGIALRNKRRSPP